LQSLHLQRHRKLKEDALAGVAAAAAQQPYQIENTFQTATPVDVASPPLPLSMFLYTVQMSPVHTECRLSCRRRTLQSRHLAYLSSDKA
jgi:hypothetical protein